MSTVWIIALDTSGSMSQPMYFRGRQMTRFQGLLTCTAGFLRALDHNTWFSLITFNETVKVPGQVCPVYQANSVLEKLWYTTPGWSTAIASAEMEIARHASHFRDQGFDVKSLLITDGRENMREDNDVIMEAERIKHFSEYYVIGVADSREQVNEPILKAAACEGGYFFCKDLTLVQRVMVSLATVSIRVRTISAKPATKQIHWF